MLARPTCRRAHACRGEPRACLARYWPLVPRDARNGVKAMLDALDRGLDFETLQRESGAIDRLIEWMDLVDDCARHTPEA